MSRTVPYGVISHLRSMFLGYATRLPTSSTGVVWVEKKRFWAGMSLGAMYVLVRGTFEDLAFLDAPSPPPDPPQSPANAPIS